MANNLPIVIRKIGKIQELKSAIIVPIKNKKNNIIIQANWSEKNYNTFEKDIVTQQYLIDTSSKSSFILPTINQDKRIIHSAISPCHEKWAHLFQKDEEQFLNIISKGVTTSVNLKKKDLHGKVYTDAELSSFCWSPDSKYVAFVAEKKRPEFTTYMDHKTEASEGKGEKYAYQDDWGEQMIGQQESVIVIVNSENDDLQILGLSRGVCGGQIVWADPTTLVGVAFVTDPYRLGLIYCRNRESFLFQLNLEGEFTQLTKKGAHVHSPRFSPNGSRLVYLRSPAGGPHVRSSQLTVMNWPEKSIEVVWDHVDTSDDQNIALSGRSFLPLQCWDASSKVVFLATSHHTSTICCSVNVETKFQRQLSVEDYSVVPLDVVGNVVVASRSSLTSAPEIIWVEATSEDPHWYTLDDKGFSMKDLIPPLWEKSYFYTKRSFNQETSPDISDFPSIYFGPKSSSDNKKYPLIVFVHGGPHSLCEDAFNPIATFFVHLGYCVLFPNYTGSVGQGRKWLEALPGHVGTYDVEDVYASTRHCLKLYDSLDESRVVLYGGSHGGFLVTHLSAQYPELYRVVVARNPVIDIASMALTSDITDWSFVESGYPFQIGAVPTPENYKKMLTMSPLHLVDKVVAPTLLLLGKADMRVPMSQGLFYYKALLARKVPTKLYVYDDNHALGKVEFEADHLIQTALWFDQHLQSPQK